MKIIENIKKYFALGSDNYEDQDPETNEDSLTADDPEPKASEQMSVHTPVEVEIDSSMREAILDGVLEVFNSALPSFVSSSIDPAAQRAELMARLDGSIKNYLDQLNSVAAKKAELHMKDVADAARDRSEHYKQQLENLEQQKNKLREQQLSADRRRRALSDRVADLENQLSRVEAEREQFQLENQSLLNKLKLADIQPGIIDDLKQEIERLRSGAPAEDPAVAQGLREELEEKDEKLAALKAELESSAARFAEERSKMADEVAEAQKVMDNIYELQEQMQKVEEVIRKRDEKIANLKSTVRKLKEDLNRAQAELKKKDEARRPAGLFALAEEPAEDYGDVEPLEDDFQCPDWFVGEPAPGKGNIHAEKMEFGYTEPPKKPRIPDNEAQLTLF